MFTTLVTSSVRPFSVLAPIVKVLTTRLLPGDQHHAHTASDNTDVKNMGKHAEPHAVGTDVRNNDATTAQATDVPI